MKFKLTTLETTTIKALIPKGIDLLEKVLVTLWKQQLKSYDSKDMQLALEKFVTDELEGGATAAAATEMDTEPTLDSQRIKDLIQENVQKDMKSMRNTLNQFCDKLRRSKGKNDGRGAGKGAPSTKKSPKKSKDDYSSKNSMKKGQQEAKEAKEQGKGRFS